MLNVGKPQQEETNVKSETPKAKKNAANESYSEVMLPVRYKIPEKTSKSETNIQSALKYHLMKH